jgi:hypothetical protein
MSGLRWVCAALALVLVFGLGGIAAAEAASLPVESRTYEFPKPKPDDVVVVSGRNGQRANVTYWLQAEMASPQDLPTIRAMSEELGRQFVRLVGKHRLEDLLSMEQKRALAAKMVIVANSELAAYDRRAGVAVVPDRVYVNDVVFKEFTMEAVK